MGLIISLSGVNGVGKTTQVETIVSELKKRNKKIIVTRIMFQYFFLNPIIQFLKPASSNSTGKITHRNTRMLPKLWFVCAFLDIWLGYLIKVLPMLKKYDYVVADRNYADMWVSLLYYGFLPNWAFIPSLKLLPRASVSILFLADPAVIEKRESGFSHNYYKEQTRIYQLLKEIPNTILIDANLHKKDVTRKIIRILDKIDHNTK